MAKAGSDHAIFESFEHVWQGSDRPAIHVGRGGGLHCFREKTSHALLVGAILHVLYAEEEKTLARVATFLSDPQPSLAHTLHRMMETNHLGTPDHPRVHRGGAPKNSTTDDEATRRHRTGGATQ